MKPPPLGLRATKGALVARVFPGSPAEAAGLRSGDVITSVADRPVDSREAFSTYTATIPSGQPLQITYTEAVRQGIEAERQALGQAGLQAAAQDQALRQEAFNAFIAGISVDQLDAYPGIGPATIARLRDTGLSDLALLRGGSLR